MHLHGALAVKTKPCFNFYVRGNYLWFDINQKGGLGGPMLIYTSMIYHIFLLTGEIVNNYIMLNEFLD